MREILVTCGYLGYAPFASGTVGSLAPAAVYAVVEALRIRLEVPAVVSTLLLGALAVASAAVGIASGRWAVERYRSKDPKPFVIDEAAGFFITAFLVPVLLPTVPLWQALPVAFVTARGFDVLKPPPARRLERLPDGWGIVLDDVASGVYSATATCLLLWWFAL